MAINKLTVPPTNVEVIEKINEVIDNKQDTLLSGTNIKTINNTSLLGSGNIDIQGGSTITVDDALSTTSENPVQNKVITTELNKKIEGITSSDVTTALGYTPYNSSNPNGYITGITSNDVTTALGYTPYNSSNPNGYTSNTGTVTSVNNVSPVNGNVTLSIPSEVTESTVSGWGFTKNTGTVTSVNNTVPVNGNVTISIPTVPTNISAFTNDSGYITSSAISNMQTTTNLVTSVSSSSTDSQYPSAKLFYDTIGDIDDALTAIILGVGSTVNLTVTLSGNKASYLTAFTINNTTYTYSDFTNNEMTISIPKNTSLSWTATSSSGTVSPSSGTVNTSQDSSLSISISGYGGKD